MRTSLKHRNHHLDGTLRPRAIAKLRVGLGAQARFAIEVDEIRSTYRAKRNFLNLLDTLF